MIYSFLFLVKSYEKSANFSNDRSINLFSNLLLSLIYAQLEGLHHSSIAIIKKQQKMYLTELFYFKCLVFFYEQYVTLAWLACYQKFKYLNVIH